MRIARSGTPCLETLAAILAGAAVAAPAVAGDTEQGKAAAGLTVAIIDLAEAPQLVPAPLAETRRPSWRTSFGSERQTEEKPKTGTAPSPLAALADADAVLIQGVRAAAPLRRLFPPRAWRLVVSRRIFASPASTPLAVTAIAVRARAGIRITAREPGLRLVLPGTEPVAGPPAAATAVRVATHGRVVWLASVALPSTCVGAASCPAESSLDAWRTSKRSNGQTTLVGGRLTAPAVVSAGPVLAGPAAPCAAHRIESDLEAAPVAPPAGATLAEGSGCISIVRIEGADTAEAAADHAAEIEDVAKSAPTP
jgi:hypothetical protein